MRKIIILTAGVLLAVVMTACDKNSNEDASILPLLLTGGGGAPVIVPAAGVPGDSETVTAGSETFKMIYANNQTSITFPRTTSDDHTATLTRRFYIGETEVTNSLFAAVLQWARDNDRIVEIAGAHNEVNEYTVKYGNKELININMYLGHPGRISYSPLSDTFSVVSGYENHPVVNVSWYGAVMFCNWLTEVIDGSSANCVYSGMDVTWDYLETVEDASRTGYRLPSFQEWEYAARYRGTDSVNTVAGYANPYFTRGNSASGATTYTTDITGAPDYAGKLANDLVAVYGSYWNGSTWIDKGTSDTAPVKSLGNASANALGLYDMSGNVWEWTSTPQGVHFIVPGGGWSGFSTHLRVGYLYTLAPALTDSGGAVGFRFARSK
jgi:formylglycine-generating enzyme required for sulfatase activity